MKDIDIRKGLKNGPLNKYIIAEDSFVIDEFNVSLGLVRADIAIVNGVLQGFEIKSPKDSLIRLENQIKEYEKFFEYFTVVTCEKFKERVINIVPNCCGITIVSNKENSSDIKFDIVREAILNNNVDKICLAKSLWKNEIIEVLEEIQYKKGFKSKSKPFLYELLSEIFTKDELLNIVKIKLKNRLRLQLSRN